MTDSPIFLPSNFQTFKQNVQRRIEINSIMTLRWNDLSDNGKLYLATKIKTHSKSKTIREHPNATIGNIINSFDLIDPLLQQTENYHKTWAFTAAYLESRKWLQILSTTLLIALKLRKTEIKNYCDFFLAYGGWGSYSIIRNSVQELEEVHRINNQTRESNPNNEITLEEVSHASPNNN